VGRILAKLDALGLRENTIIAINSDHGLQLGEHGLHKKRNFYDQTICSPLVIAAPGRIAPGTVVEDPVEMIDFLPTLLELSGMAVPEGIRGQSLVPLMKGEGTARNATFSEIDFSGEMYDELRVNSGRRVMIRTREWKLIEFRDPRVKDRDGALYDLKADPGETVNLFASAAHQEVVATLEARLTAWEGGS
jgi:arylsulfatase A-like enzyme